MTDEVYDYVIVGAGSAGCVLANRLSANPAHRVLLIEAGGSDNRFWIKMPLGYAFTFTDRRVNWCYMGAPDPGLNGRRGYVPRGKVLGGSSSINAMAYVRGLPHDFDDWEAAGAQGWNWANARASFDALETSCATGHGDGPVVVSDLRDQMHPFAKNFIAAAAEAGWPVPEDMNAEAAEGLTYMRSTVKAGRRWSSADAFLRPAMGRPNLRVVTHALVETIVIAGKRATGVTYRWRGKLRTAQAAQEVILSAGAINSPKILQLSGIGEHALLAQHGIATRAHLPEVGRGLQDHLALTTFYQSRQPTLNNILGRRTGQMMAGLRYVLTRKGPLAVPVNHCSGFVRSGPEQPHPDLQIYCNPASYRAKPSGGTEVDRAAGYLLCAQPNRPTSRGAVTITSADPAAAPHIQPNSLSTDTDCETAILAGRAIQRLAQAKTLRDVTVPGSAQAFAALDDAGLLAHFRDNASSVFHPSCTCRMGRDAAQSVLDARLRVHGIAGLRVVDASAFPNITSGNINAPTLMLASRAADLILEDQHLNNCPKVA